jgi:hypothetical protein
VIRDAKLKKQQNCVHSESARLRGMTWRGMWQVLYTGPMYQVGSAALLRIRPTLIEQKTALI